MIARSAFPQLLRSRWDREFESVFLQRRVSSEPSGRGRVRAPKLWLRHADTEELSATSDRAEATVGATDRPSPNSQKCARLKIISPGGRDTQPRA